MIPSLNLDNQKFAEIFAAARPRMDQFCADTLDLSYQDPGVALLEMLCLLKDMQQHYLNYVDDAHVLKYAKLLGGTVSLAPQPAKTTLVFAAGSACTLPEGFPVYGGDIPFETVSPLLVTENKIAAVSPKTYAYPFGRHPQQPTVLSVGFTFDLFTSPIHALWVVSANQTDGDPLPYPLGQLRAEYYAQSGRWETADILDHTHCFTRSGTVALTVPAPMTPLEIEGECLYWIRFILAESQFELPPTICGLYLNGTEAIQRRTIARSAVLQPSADGILRLPFYLAQNGMIELQSAEKDGHRTVHHHLRLSHDTIRIDSEQTEPLLLLAWAQDIDPVLGKTDGTPCFSLPKTFSGEIRQIQIGSEREGIWQNWSFMEDLFASGPMDRHFTVKENAIVFGNGEKGAVPPKGLVRVIDSTHTLGLGGLVQADAIRHCPMEGLSVRNPLPSAGGEDAPPPEKVLGLARMKIQRIGKAVTPEDIQRIVLEMPNLSIDCVKAVCKDGLTTEIYVKPKSTSPLPRLNAAYRQNIRAYIEPYRLLTARIAVSGVRYAAVTISADITIAAGTIDPEALLREALSDILPPCESANRFREWLSHGECYGVVANLPFVRQVRHFTLECDGKRIQSGRCRLGEDAIPYLAGLNITRTIGGR